ncbi:MAG: hypothetical protein OES99_06400 [Gammaproteobacteria bacterium]|nr:hypothetical protein [Gammaproteobacteria bacterium]
MLTIIYYLGIAALFTHEMDAVMRSEWELLFYLKNLNEAVAYPIFLILHFPLFFIFLWLSHHGNDRIRTLFRYCVSVFLMIHLGLHLLLSDDPNNAFHGLIANLFIYLAAGCGLVYLLVALRRTRGAWKTQHRP